MRINRQRISFARPPSELFLRLRFPIQAHAASTRRSKSFRRHPSHDRNPTRSLFAIIYAESALLHGRARPARFLSGDASTVRGATSCSPCRKRGARSPAKVSRVPADSATLTGFRCHSAALGSRMRPDQPERPSYSQASGRPWRAGMLPNQRRAGTGRPVRAGGIRRLQRKASCPDHRSRVLAWQPWLRTGGWAHRPGSGQ